MKRFKAKVCVVGDPAVGKTSLVRRYVMGDFAEDRRATVGAEVSTRGQFVDLRDIGLTLSKLTEGARIDWPSTFHLDMIVWDIMGAHPVPDDVRVTYFESARGILAVADTSREETFAHLDGWITAAKRTAGGVPVVVALNKTDLVHRTDVASAEALAEAHDASLFRTSAKTNEKVEKAFRNLAADVVLNLLGF
ncbi:MAG: Rab family GTPase [Methanobacteriota archaeon]